METNVNYTIAGAFVILLLSSIVFAIIWLSSGFNEGSFTFYRVYMQESVTGLSLDSAVEFNGVNVGTVDEIKINEQNPQVVELLLKVQADTPVTYGTRAKLGMRALAGIAYILLEDKGKDMRRLVANKDQPYPVILTTPSILMRLDTMLTQINDSFHRISDSVGNLLDDQNLHYFKQLLQSGQSSMRLLETQTIPELTTITRNLSGVAAEIRQNPAILIRGKEPPTQLGPGEK